MTALNLEMIAPARRRDVVPSFGHVAYDRKHIVVNLACGAAEIGVACGPNSGAGEWLLSRSLEMVSNDRIQGAKPTI